MTNENFNDSSVVTNKGDRHRRDRRRLTQDRHQAGHDRPAHGRRLNTNR
jgi:hypothetical protein